MNYGGKLIDLKADILCEGYFGLVSNPGWLKLS